MKEGGIVRHRIKKFRESQKLTQIKLAEKLHYNRNYIYLMESGRAPVTDRFIRDLCDKLGANEEWLRTGKGSMLSAKTEEEEFAIWAARHLKIDSDSFKRRFVRAMMNLSDDDWKVLEKYINDMTKDPAK